MTSHSQQNVLFSQAKKNKTPQTWTIKQLKDPHEENSKPSLFAVVHILAPVISFDFTYIYWVNTSQEQLVQPGIKIRIPFGNSSVSGYIIGLFDSIDAAYDYHHDLNERLGKKTQTPREDIKILPIQKIQSLNRILSPHIYKLAISVAFRYGGSIGDILDLAIADPIQKIDRTWAQEHPETCDPNTSSRILLDLTDSCQETRQKDTTPERKYTSIPSTYGQHSVYGWAGIKAYEILNQAPDHSGNVLILTPNQWTRNYCHRLLTEMENVDSDTILVYDTQAKKSDRYETFLNIATRSSSEENLIIIGNRNSIFLPIDQLAAVIMIADDDYGFQEDRSPYYNARDVSLVRITQENLHAHFINTIISPQLARLIEKKWIIPEKLTPLEFNNLRPYIETVDTDFDQDKDPILVHSRLPTKAYQLIASASRLGPVLVQIGLNEHSNSFTCSQCFHPARCNRDHGPFRAHKHLTINSRHVSDSSKADVTCSWCQTDATQWVCHHCGNSRLIVSTRSATSTAEQFQKMFPETKVGVSTAHHRLEFVSQNPHIIICTPGAEPIADQGYLAGVILDTDIKVGFDRLETSYESLRQWVNAASTIQGRHHNQGSSSDNFHGKVVITGQTNDMLNSFVSGRYDYFVTQDNHQRQELSLPPYVRSVLLVSTEENVNNATNFLTTLNDGEPLDFIELDHETIHRQRYLTVTGKTSLGKHDTSEAGLFEVDPEGGDEKIIERLIFFTYSKGHEMTKQIRQYRMSLDKKHYTTIIVDPQDIL